MIAREAVGKKIVRVVQERVRTDYGFEQVIRRIELDNGTRLVFTVVELPTGYAVEMTTQKEDTK